MRSFGVDEETIAEVLDDGNEGDAFEVWPENWQTLELFIACRQQWRVGAMGGYHGLSASGAHAVMHMKRVPIKEQWPIFEDLQAMAGAAMKLLNKKDD